MNYHQIRVAEECLYARKYLYGRCMELSIAMETMFPQLPGSIMKMIGKPQAKTPQYTSETERWGIIRATCDEAVELDAKTWLMNTLKTFKAGLSREDHQFIRYLYEKEHQPARVQSLLRINSQTYYTTRLRLLRKLWQELREHEDILDIAVL